MKTLKQHLEENYGIQVHMCEKNPENCDLLNDIRKAVVSWLKDHYDEENNKRRDSCNCCTCTDAIANMRFVDRLVGELEEA